MIDTWISVPVSYFSNGIIISKMKMFFLGKYFFFRYLIGAMCTQAAPLLTSYPISLSGKYAFNELVIIISTTWTCKVIISITLLPLARYLAMKLKKIENTDHYEWGESYNPLKVFANDEGRK